MNFLNNENKNKIDSIETITNKTIKKKIQNSPRKNFKDIFKQKNRNDQRTNRNKQQNKI